MRLHIILSGALAGQFAGSEGTEGETTMAIRDINELRTAIREGFDYGAINGTTPPHVLRDFYEVTDDISDEEIEEAFGSEFREQTHDVLVAVCVNNGAVFGAKTIDMNDGLTVQDIEALSKGMADDIGDPTDLRVITSREDLHHAAIQLFLMPEGLYEAGHGEHTKRFGRDIGFYRNLAAA